MSNKKQQIILGIESSCDETACAVCLRTQDSISLLSNIVASSQSLHIKYGGIIPEQAAREQLKAIIPVIEEALSQADLILREIDAIAFTQGPGLIGSLLVGVETAKTLSLAWNKPLIPINHLIGHFYANWINKTLSEQPKFPFLGLLVSGGHSDLVLFRGHNRYEYLGGTRDDAAGECFDKCARLLGLPYPGGPQISKQARLGDPTQFKLPVPMKNSKDYDFSFSGLKTAVSNLVKKIDLTEQTVNNLSASIEQTITMHLVDKTIMAGKLNNIEQIVIAGGVAANLKLRQEFQQVIAQQNLNISLLIPPPELCTDNAAMIAAAGFFAKPAKDAVAVDANPNLSLAFN